MKCTACASETMVISTRGREGGIYRRRECPACGTRFSTLEAAVGMKPGPKPTKPAPPPRVAKPRAARPAPRQPAPARRLDDHWMRAEQHDFQEDLREAGIDTTHFG